ncbi:hypothetical protein Vadar_026833 [Vaccinium darrowii]|uniref:Uncharacterized protein n=1 Tax=Vaccinium darrowii TaxID=229202 RepID=A0ACB7YGA9_9ERIC|nr:hypothetical protein Vadar_026833 [Vaccinium darrowii]
MYIVLDLRFVVPVFINLALFFLHHHLPYELNLSMNWATFFAILISILFLTTSVKLPLYVTAEPIRAQPRDFSFLLAISLLGSFFLPQSLFGVVFVVTIFLSPWHRFLFESFVRFLIWIWDVLCEIPVLIITCIVQRRQQDERETNTAPPQVVAVAVDIEGNPILHEQPISEPIMAIVVQP